MIEFTGERVIPGEVDPDLWSEHLGRYAFAARLARRKKVLDAGCGTGYGAAELASTAAAVAGVDLSGEAVAYARSHYTAPNLAFLQASCTELPFAGGAFDLVVSFELIEHLDDWRSFLDEIRRVLAPSGQCILSTPNKHYYEETRATTGPNPYHRHEFGLMEFQEELRAFFPHIALYSQNHVNGIVFVPGSPFSGIEARLESAENKPEEAHFLVAVCALGRQTGSPAFLYVPRASNVLWERERHISSLERQLAERTEERDHVLATLRAQAGEMERQAAGYEEQIRILAADAVQKVTVYESQIEELRKNIESQAAGYEEQIAILKKEMERQAAGYEEQVRQLKTDVREKADWATQVSNELRDKCQELSHAVDVLHETERSLEERTKWAQDLDARIQQIESLLNTVRMSRWMKLGGTLGIAPRLNND